MKKLITLTIACLVNMQLVGMEQGFNALTKTISKFTHYLSKKSNQKGYVCDRENKNKYNDVYDRLKGEKSVEKMRNNTFFQERTKQCNDRSWQAQDFIKKNLEGSEYKNLGALTEAFKNNYPALSLIFLEYTLLALQEGKVVEQKHMDKFLAGKKLIIESIKDIWPELKNKIAQKTKSSQQPTTTTPLSNTEELESSEDESNQEELDPGIEKKLKNEEAKQPQNNTFKNRKRKKRK